MGKKSVLLIIVVISWVAGYFIVGNYANIPNGTPAEKAKFALEEAGCIMCHSKDAKMPFYGNIPIIGTVVKSDMENGLRAFDMTSVIKSIDDKTPANETALAKIEYAVDSGIMPPFKFKIFHWSANMSPDEKNAVLDWISAERKILNAESGVAPKFANEPVWPIPAKLDVDMKKVELGAILYHHRGLSGDGTVSCATCHPLDKGGVDAMQTSTGIRDQKGDINAPTVFNAVFNAKQFWDGRADTLEAQAGGPPMNPVEMDGVSWNAVAKRLEGDAEFAAQFKKIYPDGFTEANITDAIATFEKTLITPDSDFDLYLKGDETALTPRQIEGYEIFKKARCYVCHSGQNLGGQTFEYMGLNADYFKDRGKVGKINDKGRASFTGDERDIRKFKTPSLRNVALTAPYFHDGSATTLKQAVEIMAKYQRGIELEDYEIDSLVKFLEALIGKYKGEHLNVKN